MSKKNISVKKDKHQPTHEECRKAIEQYLKNGGEIRMVEPDYISYMSLPHTSQADNFLLES